MSSKVSRGVDSEEYEATESNDSFECHPAPLRLPEPDQSESNGIDTRPEPLDAVAVELVDPDETMELFDPNDWSASREGIDSVDMFDLKESIEYRETINMELLGVTKIKPSCL